MVNSRQKGKRRELELCEMLRDLGYLSARRSAQYCGAAGDADIADAIPGVHIECKGVEKLNLRLAMGQSCLDAARLGLSHEGGPVPVVIHKTSRQPWLVTLRLRDLHEFCLRAARARSQPTEVHDDCSEAPGPSA